jgi:hypothetical protein
MFERWTTSAARLAHSPAIRVAVLTLYYLSVLAALLYLHGRGQFKSPPFIYQGF